MPQPYPPEYDYWDGIIQVNRRCDIYALWDEDFTQFAVVDYIFPEEGIQIQETTIFELNDFV